MGCRMAAFLDSGSPRAVEALKQVPAWFEEWEQALSRFRPDSDLNRLNAAAGTSVRVGQALWEVVAASLETARWTGGLVVPTVLKSLEQEGYDRSFDLIQSGQAERMSPGLQRPGVQLQAAGKGGGKSAWMSAAARFSSRMGSAWTWAGSPRDGPPTRPCSVWPRSDRRW